MELEQFNKHIRVLGKEEAERYRDLYINKFVDPYTHAKCYGSTPEVVEMV